MDAFAVVPIEIYKVAQSRKVLLKYTHTENIHLREASTSKMYAITTSNIGPESRKVHIYSRVVNIR